MVDKPQRAKTPYNFFYQDMFQKVRDIQVVVDNVDPYTPIFHQISDRWKRLDPKDKAYYEHLADLDKRRYMNELVEWHRARHTFDDFPKTLVTTTT